MFHQWEEEEHRGVFKEQDILFPYKCPVSLYNINEDTLTGLRSGLPASLWTGSLWCCWEDSDPTVSWCQLHIFLWPKAPVARSGSHPLSTLNKHIRNAVEPSDMLQPPPPHKKRAASPLRVRCVDCLSPRLSDLMPTIRWQMFLWSSWRSLWMMELHQNLRKKG